MAIQIYNTITGKKEKFEPLEPGKVGMYVCGPTVYDACHIGHARSVVVFDVIARYFRFSGYDVTYVRNFTDIDDKIIDRAAKIKIEPHELARHYIKEFYQDMDPLNVERPTHEPKATEHIAEIISVIEILIKKDMAYEVDGDVFFKVDMFKDYGKLSRRKLEDMEAGARIDVDEKKQNPFDFVLWKSEKPGEPSWESPWGKGRPGWHIECSAMSSKFLGQTFDIHGGGKDLIFPHHENEIAQSEAAFTKPFVKYWVHNGFVNIDHEKMSKSLGNFKMIKDVIKAYHPEAIRLFLLSNHYRSPVDFTDKSMDEATTGLDKIYALLNRIEKIAPEKTRTHPDEQTDYFKRFCMAMDDDFNTAQGIGVLFDMVRHLNRTLDDAKEEIDEKTKGLLLTGRAEIAQISDVLGILTQSPETYLAQKKSKVLEKASLAPDVIEKMIQERNEARKSKNWARADEIRDELEAMNIILEDRAEGTVWKVGK